LPCIGDHVVVKNHMTGVVRYIGPIVGDKKRQYAGLHLDSPGKIIVIPFKSGNDSFFVC